MTCLSFIVNVVSVLQAICILVKERLSKDALDKLKKEGIKVSASLINCLLFLSRLLLK